MTIRRTGRLGSRIAGILAATAAAGMLASCSVAPSSSKVQFSEAEYGVPASPRMVAGNRSVPKGGGRYMLGEPYRVAGRTYVPRDNPSYSAVGLASWYGPEFHGRKTANGEVYDMKELTAAHPTLPLPCYARVTNLANGRSIVVRVNDRGPFSRSRIIDVSSTVADVLDFKRAGTARVQVDYVGLAQMDGRDRNDLMATYRGPGVKTANTLVADNSTPLRMHAPTPVAADFGIPDEPLALAPASLNGDDPLGPLILKTSMTSSYLPTDRFSRAHEAAATMAAGTAVRATLDGPPPERPAAATVQIGTFADPANAKRIAAKFMRFGSVTFIDRESNGRTIRIVRVLAIKASAEAIVEAATASGLPGAFIVEQ